VTKLIQKTSINSEYSCDRTKGANGRKCMICSSFICNCHLHSNAIFCILASYYFLFDLNSSTRNTQLKFITFHELKLEMFLSITNIIRFSGKLSANMSLDLLVDPASLKISN
jgi:hypothetical protein